jgi:hypothetical protein
MFKSEPFRCSSGKEYSIYCVEHEPSDAWGVYLRALEEEDDRNLAWSRDVVFTFHVSLNGSVVAKSRDIECRFSGNYIECGDAHLIRNGLCEVYMTSFVVDITVSQVTI